MPQYLNPALYRFNGATENDPEPNQRIYRADLDQYLDRGLISVAMRNGRWWTIRRNGRTQTWKRDANRIRIPFKAGLYVYGAITETDFVSEREG